MEDKNTKHLINKMEYHLDKVDYLEENGAEQDRINYHLEKIGFIKGRIERMENSRQAIEEWRAGA